MTIYDFRNNHIVYNVHTDKPMVHSLTILNAAPGSECMKMCGLFRLPMSSGMMRDSVDNDYVSFKANKDGLSSYWIGSDYEPKKVTKVIYYPEIEPIIDEIFLDYPELAEQTPGRMKEEFDSNKLYKALGMGIIKEKD